MLAESCIRIVTKRESIDEKTTKDLIYYTDTSFDENIKTFLIKLKVAKRIRQITALVPQYTLIVKSKLESMINVPILDLRT